MVVLAATVEEQIRALREAILVAQYWQSRGFARPSETYKPHELGQRQFHESKAIIRGLFPGNGFGKTRCISEEAHAWCTHSNRWQKTPAWPIQALWLARSKAQFTMLRNQIEVDTIGTLARWKESDKCYIYEDGSTLTVGVAAKAGDWHKYEGINPDLVLFDEMPRQDIWREMMMRRRGKKKTRYAVAATATSAGSWAQAEIYDPWLAYHQELGLPLWDEDAHPKRLPDGELLLPVFGGEDAHSVNSFADVWLWTHGGIYSNPAADSEDFRWYEARKWTSEKERKVRLWGGFENWLGDSVFDEAGLMYLLQRATELRRITAGVRAGRIVGYRS